MKKFIIVFLFTPLLLHSQKGITFQIEELERPEKRLSLTHINDFYENRILSDMGLDKFDLKRNDLPTPAYNIVAQSSATDSIFSFGSYNSFFMGMYQAYADHRPFVLSPDMIWLLISQGFARHVNNNAESLRKHFVDFEGKTSLIVTSNEVDIDNPNSPWENIFPKFTKQIGDYTDEELVKTMVADFSTTTRTSKVASEITLMEATKEYFEFIVIYIVCGIPEVTLEGTTEDWQKILDKARYLKKYDLNWWIKEIEPILEEFVKTSQGDIDKTFWRNMFKYHDQKKYGAPRVFDGWIVKFYPYNTNGKRNGLKEIKGIDGLPSEIVKVDLTYKRIDKSGETETIPLELWAGFTGLKQNDETFALKPEIGWMIRKKDIERESLRMKLDVDNRQEGAFGGIQIRVSKVPKELLELKKMKSLRIDFIDRIDIPNEMADIVIEELELNGKIFDLEIQRLEKLFPNTLLKINGKLYNH